MGNVDACKQIKMTLSDKLLYNYWMLIYQLHAWVMLLSMERPGSMVILPDLSVVRKVPKRMKFGINEFNFADV